MQCEYSNLLFCRGGYYPPARKGCAARAHVVCVWVDAG